MTYIDPICKNCKKFEYCIYPCDAWYEEHNKKHTEDIIPQISKPCNPTPTRVSEDDISNKTVVLSEQQNDDNNIQNFLEFDVGDDVWLDVVNNHTPWDYLIDVNSLLLYFKEENIKYCKKYNLCSICRAELIEKEDPRGEHFGIPCSEKILVCPNCG